jgi:translation initiation factor 1A
MPNTRGGNKYKSGKKGQRTQADETLPVIADNPNCYYGLVNKKLGTSFEVTINGKSERAIMRGKMRKKYWINIGDIVMCQFDLGEYIIVHKYKPDESKQLRVMGEIDFGKDDEGGSAITFDDDVENNSDDELFEEMNKLKKQDEIDKDKKKKEVKILVPETKKKELDSEPKKKGLNKELSDALDASESGSENENESESKSGSDSDPEDGNDDESSDIPENPNRIDDANDEKIEDKKLKKQFGGKARGNKIINERKRTNARDKKDTFNTWVDGI